MCLPSRLVPEYEEGVQKFIAQARNYAKTREVILCPCKRSQNKKYMKFDQVSEHLIMKGIDPFYTIWVFHGETYTSQFQSEGSSRRVQEEEDESRETYHLYRDVFVTEEEVGHTMFADTTVTRSQVWIEGHKKKNGQSISQAIEDKIKEIEECPPESLSTTNIVEDAISLVFDKEAHGRVRGMGFGVKQSKIGASVEKNKTVKHLESIVHNLQEEMKEMRIMFLQNIRLQNEKEQVASGGIGSGIGNYIDGDNNVNVVRKHCSVAAQVTSGGIGSGIGNYVDGNNNINGVRKHSSVAAQSKLKSVSYGYISDNAKCKLLHWSVDGVVAEGRIASTDPKVKVHHVPFGASCWKVWIDRVFVEKVDLIRPNDEMFFLEDAIGSTVAWLSKFIVLCG